MTPRPRLRLAAGALLGFGPAALLVWPGTASETAVAPTTGSCDPVSAMVVSGDQEARRWTSLPHEAAIDAREAVWSGSDDWPDHVEGGEGLCWEGGEIRGTFDDEVTWEELTAPGRSTCSSRAPPSPICGSTTTATASGRWTMPTGSGSSTST